MVSLESVGVKHSLSNDDVPVQIMDHQVRRLRNNEITSVKVLWRSQSVEGAIWQAEAGMKDKYPNLFPSDSPSAWGNSSSLVFQSFMRKISLNIMFNLLVLVFLTYLHVHRTQFSQKFNLQCLVVGLQLFPSISAILVFI